MCIRDSGSYNQVFGHYCGYNISTGEKNTGMGRIALYNTTTGSHNAAFGYEAMAANTTGFENAAFGEISLTVNTTGYGHSGFGAETLRNVTTGIYNTACGYAAGTTTTTGGYNTSLGFDAEPSSSTASNEVTFGDANVTSLRCAVTSISSLSDERDKTDIVDLPVGLDFVNTLRPIKFKWQTREGTNKDGTERAGFTAQQLKSAQTDAAAEYMNLVYESNPDKLEAMYGNLIPVLVQAIKDLSAEVSVLKSALGA